MTVAASEFAPAKINLALHVTGRREDGYHTLESLVAFAEIGDVIEAEIARKDSLSVAGPFAEMLRGGGINLVLRALARFREEWPGTLPDGLSLRLIKNLPVASGIGGGSADAAAALRLFASMATPHLAAGALFGVAQSLGADVPVCLGSRPAVMRGIGDIITPLPLFPGCAVVMINPLRPLATSEVFRRLDHRTNPKLPLLPEPLAHAGMLAMWLQDTRNDLEAPAIALLPVIGRLVERLRIAPGCLLARMSGSGATVFGLFGSQAQAHNLAHELRAEFPDFWVAAARLIRP